MVNSQGIVQDVLEGPAIIREPLSTTYIVSGQKANIGMYGEIHIVGMERN